MRLFICSIIGLDGRNYEADWIVMKKARIPSLDSNAQIIKFLSLELISVSKRITSSHGLGLLLVYCEICFS